MDILIKSFNRPYYLDRCIQSIVLNSQNSEYKIVVLDDGTPQKYLDKLLKKYPEIKILKSDLYDEKSNAIANDIQIINSKIPIELWINSAKNASNYFLLIEDDFWFTTAFNLKKFRLNLETDKIKMLKLCWLGNSKLLPEKTISHNNLYSIYCPNLYTENPFLFNLIFRIDRFKIRKILTFFKFYNEERFLKYYTIYATSGAVFKKKYFLNLWKNHKNSVDEGLQLLNAVKFINKKKKSSNFGFSNIELMKTGFLSSASNQNKAYDDVAIDMFAFNKIINEAWFNNDFDAMENYPKDLNSEKMEAILVNSNNPLAQVSEWKKWVQAFKNQYISFGCKID
jgi:glycosyltransferase involved in cell wall biosynthesis